MTRFGPLLRHWAALACLLVSMGACGKSSGPSSTGAASASPATQIPPGSLPITSTASSPPPPAVVGTNGFPLSFAPLARRADPAIATVRARVERQTRSGRKKAIGEGLGTAFVYDRDGFMLTNHHVIDSATDITVGFIDGRELQAKVVGADKPTDVAVLQVDAHDLPALPLGDSDRIQVGDWVVAIGNPFGLSHTVSAGILSAKDRTNDDVKGLDPTGYFNFLQTDASINLGNSGGPLLDVNGEVVGINSAVRANANSIGFAIPINMVKQLLPMLLRDGKIQRSGIGMSVKSLSVVEATRLKRPDRKGAWVTEVAAGGPAERAGVAMDDVVIGFDGRPISDPNELRWLASIAGVNKTVTLRIARLERTFDVRVTLSELDLMLKDLRDESDDE